MDKLISVIEEMANKYGFSDEDFAKVNEAFAELEVGANDEFNYEMTVPAEEDIEE